MYKHQWNSIKIGNGKIIKLTIKMLKSKIMQARVKAIRASYMKTDSKLAPVRLS